MTIRYKCEECGAALNIKDELAGTSGRCPRCKAEFVVPPAGFDSAAPAHHGAVAADARVAGDKPAASAGASGDNLSDDDIESILEGKSPGARESYGVADSEDDDAGAKPARVMSPDIPDIPDDDDDDDRSLRRKSPKTPAQELPAVSVSSVARDLMARGDKSARQDHGLGIDERKGGRPFGGEGRRDADDDEFTTAEKAAFFLKYAGPVIGVLLLVGTFYWWYLKSWRAGSVPDLGYVSGTVTLDGDPVKNALVQFVPLASDAKKDVLYLGSAAGYTDEAGRYALVYTAEVLGAPLGDHVVRIEKADEFGKPLIPPQFNGGASTLRGKVNPGNNVINFTLDSKDTSGAPQPGGRR